MSNGHPHVPIHQVVRMLGGMRVYQILTNLYELLKSMYQLTACESAK